MKQKLKIFMVFPEIAPFAGDAEVGMVGASLPLVFKEMGHDVRIISPQYRVINERRYVLRDVIRLQNIDVPLGDETVRVNVKSAFIPNSKVQVYFIDYKPFFFREGLYTDPKNRKPYPDNAKRFILFSRSVLETLTKLQWQPDVIHCHGWQSGLVPFFLKSVYNHDVFYQKMSSLFTIHDFSNEGRFPNSCVQDMALVEETASKAQLIDSEGQCNFLRAGIVHADMVNTVSKRSAEQVLIDSEIGLTVKDVLKKRGSKFTGIPGGIDDGIWNPETDAYIPEKFNLKDMQGKAACRAALIDRFKLKISDDTPIVALISLLTEEKGIGLIQECFERIMRLNIALVLNGSGEKTIQRFFSDAGKKFAGRLGVSTVSEAELTHLIYAGSDMVLIPSKFEVDGIGRLSAMRYGTVPVIHAIGGMADRIKPYSPDTGKGTGFIYEEFKAKSMLKALDQAVRLFKDHKAWSQLMKACMREDLSWQNPAKKYIQLYSRCLPMKK